MTQSVFTRFLLWLSVLTGVLFGAVVVLTAQFGSFFTLSSNLIGGYLLSFFVVSLVSGYLVIRSSSKRGVLLIQSIMGSTIIKFFLYIGVLSVFVLSVPGHSKEIGAYFFLFYVTFTVFEKTFLIKSLSGEEK